MDFQFLFLFVVVVHYSVVNCQDYEADDDKEYEEYEDYEYVGPKVDEYGNLVYPYHDPGVPEPPLETVNWFIECDDEVRVHNTFDHVLSIAADFNGKDLKKCQYSVNRTGSYRDFDYFVLKFTNLQVKYSKDCTEEFIEIRDGDESGNLIGRYCGEDLPNDILTSGSEIFVRIVVSDGNFDNYGHTTPPGPVYDQDYYHDYNEQFDNFDEDSVFKASLFLHSCFSEVYDQGKTNRFCDDINYYHCNEKCAKLDASDCNRRKESWPDCPHNPEFIGDGICDYKFALEKACNYDGGDCYLNPKYYKEPITDPNQFCKQNKSSIGNGVCEKANINIKCDYDGGDCCKESYIGDGICHFVNNFESCGGHDGGDCNKNWPYCGRGNSIADGECNDDNLAPDCNHDGGDCCSNVSIKDRICDERNNFASCGNYDGGDCRLPNMTEWPGCPHNPEFIGDGTCDSHLTWKSECNHDGGDCCVQSWIGDGGCDDRNNFASCGNFDGGDCQS